MVVIENKMEEMNKGFLSFLINKKVPAAAIPNKAMLTTRKAKWQNWITDKILINPISKSKVANDIKNMPMKSFFMLKRK